MKVDINTKLVTLIGTPLSQSFAARMQNAGYEAAGCRILNGLGMSLYQGVAQIELWTGRKAPVERMRQELLDIVKENG